MADRNFVSQLLNKSLYQYFSKFRKFFNRRRVVVLSTAFICLLLLVSLFTFVRDRRLEQLTTTRMRHEAEATRLDELSRQYPDSPMLLYTRAVSHAELGNYSVALQVIERALILDPTNPTFLDFSSYISKQLALK